MSPSVETATVEKRLLRITEVSRYLNLHPDVIRKMIVSGELKAIRRPGKHTPWLVDIRECDRWIDKNSAPRPGPRHR